MSPIIAIVRPSLPPVMVVGPPWTSNAGSKPRARMWTSKTGIKTSEHDGGPRHMMPAPHDARKGHHYDTRRTGKRRSIVVITLAGIMHPCGHHAPLRASCTLAVIMRPCGHHVSPQAGFCTCQNTLLPV